MKAKIKNEEHEIQVLETVGLTTSGAQGVIEARQMCRQQAFASLTDHAWYSKLVKRLSMSDAILCQQFLDSHGCLSRSNFELAVNRMFIGQDRPKNWKLIMELLSVVNTLAETT